MSPLLNSLNFLYENSPATSMESEDRLPGLEFPTAAQLDPRRNPSEYQVPSYYYPSGSFSSYYADPVTTASTFFNNGNIPNLLTSLSSLATDFTGTDGLSGLEEGVNGSSNSTEPVHTQFPYHMLGFTAACAFIIAILGASGNLLTIIALPMCRSLRTTATAFVVNLAVVELLFCVCVLPLSGAQYAYLMLYNTSLLSDSACIYFTVMRYALTQVELQCIVAIALMRALAVSCTGFYARVNRPRVVGAYIAVLWIYSFALKIPTAFGVYGHYRFNYVTMECDMGVDIPSKIARFYMMLYEAIVPVLVIILLYIFIFVMIVRRSLRRARQFKRRCHALCHVANNDQVKLSSRRVFRAATTKRSRPTVDATTDVTEDLDPEGGGSEGAAAVGLHRGVRKMSSASFRTLKRMVSETSFRSTFSRRSSNLSQKLVTSRRDMRVARTIFIIFVIVMVCSVPVIVVHTIGVTATNKNEFLAVHILYWLQYCVNVLIYVLMNRQYRDAYLELLSKLVPSWKRHKGFMFPWEAPSQSSRPTNPQPGHNGSTKSRRGSLKDSPSSKDTDGTYGGVGHNRAARLSAIPERGSSSVGDDALSHDVNLPILPLATPPQSPARMTGSAPQSPTKSTGPPSPFITTECQFTSLPSSPMGCYPAGPVVNSSSMTSFGSSQKKRPQQGQTSSNDTSSQSRKDLQTMRDKLDSISVDSSTPLEAINEGEEPHQPPTNQDQGSTAQSPAIEAGDSQHPSYATVDGTSLDRPSNCVEV